MGSELIKEKILQKTAEVVKKQYKCWPYFRNRTDKKLVNKKL